MEGSQSCSIACPDHRDKPFTIFCPEHNVVLCKTCSSTKHKTCDTETIFNASKGFKDNLEYIEFVDKLKEIDKNAQTTASTATANVNAVDEENGNALKKIREFRAEINAYLDEREKELIQGTELKLGMERITLKNRQRELNMIQTEVNVLKETLSLFEKDSNDLFVTVKQVLRPLEVLQSKLAECAKHKSEIVCMFTRNQILQELVETRSELGTLEIFYKDGSNPPAIGVSKLSALSEMCVKLKSLHVRK